LATTVRSAVRSIRGSRGIRKADQLDALLALAPWGVMTVGTVIASIHLDQSGLVPDVILIPGLALTFASLVLRLLVGAIRRRERRFGYLALLAALALWAAGSAQVNAAPTGALSHFPAPGEWLFLASAVAMAAHLVLDVASRVRPSPTDWLEAIVASGGAVCVVALFVLAPFSDEFARQGVALLVALVYPVTDAVLLAFVVAQVALRKRALSPATFVMAVGLVVLTAADTFGSAVNILRLRPRCGRLLVSCLHARHSGGLPAPS
jgi:hypothetical protein